MDMITDTCFTHNSHPARLDTPPPPMSNRNDIENTPESKLPDEFNEFARMFSLSSDTDQIQQQEIITSDLQILKETTVGINKTLLRQKKSNRKIEKDVRKNTKSIARIETKLEEQQRSQQYIISMLERLTQSNNNNTQRFTQSNISESPLSDPAVQRSHEEKPIDEANNNGIENNQPRHIPSSSCDEIDKIRSEKTRGKTQIGQGCYEIIVETTDAAPSLNTSTEPKDPINCQLSRHVTTPNYRLSTCKDGPTTISLLHPLKRQLEGRVDRGTTLTDCRGKSPVLVVCGDKLPNDTHIEIAAVCCSPKGCFYSTYQFSDNKGGYKDLDSRLIKTSDSSLQIFELDNLKLCKRCNNNMKAGETFALKPYPSGQVENTMIKGPKQLSEEYNQKEIKLAVRCFQNEKLLLNGYIFYSNSLSASKNQLDQYHLQISTIYPCQKTISFDDNKQCTIGFLIKVPEPFHYTLASGYKWIEISVISNGILNPMYAIDTGDDQKKNPNYINIKYGSFKKYIKIIKQTLAEAEVMHGERQFANLFNCDFNTNDMDLTTSDRFRIQIQLIHSEVVPNESSKEYDENCGPWKSEEFIENIAQESHDEKRIGIDTGRKRSNNNIGLPVCIIKVPKLSDITHDTQ